MPLVHDELRRLARRYMGRERVGHTLQPTALVHEAYLRLVDLHRVRWQDRGHFFAVASTMMRRIRWLSFELICNSRYSTMRQAEVGGNYRCELFLR